MICYCTLISTFLVLFQVVYSLPTKYSGDDLERLLELLYNKGQKGHKTPMDRWKNGRVHLISGDLKKPELVLNSLAQDYGERQLDYLPDGAHKPKNLNRHNKQEQSAEEKDVHKVSTHVEIPNSATKRNYYHDIGWRWPNRTVYYAIDYPSFSPFIAQAEDKIKSSLALLEDAACIKWEDVTGTSTAYNHILFYGNTTACASYVGYIKTKEQKIWLGPGCLWTSIVLHEVLHALGAWHEQQRTDREGNIDMLFQNINPHALGNFELRQTREYAPFDLGSILQYGLSSFATQTGLQTMSIPDKGLEYLITNSKNDLSFYDKLNLNRYYDCAATCSLSCLNGGFEKMNYLGVCSCECPDGLIGLDCSQLDTSPGCGGFIDLTTPGTSQVIEMTSYNTNLLCTWLIKTPVKTKVKATIEQLDLPDSENNNCFHFLIFRDYLIGEPGKQACGNTSGAVYSKYLHGEENMMMIRFDSISYPDVTPGSGFRVKVEAMPSGCYSHPCKFGATCHEQSSVDQYTCSCPQGFSGKNCEIVTATAIVRSTFEQDFTGSVFQQDPTSTFWWSIVSVKNYIPAQIEIHNTYVYTITKHNFGGTTVYPHSGNLFASMIGYLTVIYLHTTSKLRTEAKFQAAERCLNISYIMDNQTHPTYPEYFTKFIVTVLDGENVLNEYTYFGDTGTKWRHKLVDLPAVNDLRVEITGVFGWNTLGIDDLLILPAPCDCVSHQCLHGHCVSNGGTYTCHCQTGYSGDYCEILDVVDGGYTEWSVWTTCTTTCGEGTQTRTRTCTNPTPMNGGSDCVGESNQSQSCQIQACPVDGGYTEWSAWSTCDCVEGTQTRTRTCTNPTPANGGSDCVGESSQTQTCTAEGCQIDGGYTEWSVWSTCTATCGEGTQTRTRTCTNPIPQNGGADCDGEGSQTQSCNIQGCPIDGGYTEWSAWSMCDCVEGTQTRTRTCTNPTPANGGSDCVGESSQTQTCTAEGCQIDGGYTEWSVWSTCTATCGEGTQTRTRTCTHPIPQNGGADCDGEGSQTQSCNIQGCPIDGGYTEWSAWSTCDCVEGTQTRTRTCTNPTPANGGSGCVGESSQTQTCTAEGCQIDGGYTEWSVWSTCTATCGEGTQTRTRTCTNPIPQNGGADCDGEGSQTQSCNIQGCPIDGCYTEWSAWSTCDCVEGTQTRTRTCTNPTPANGGSDCVGESSQTQACTTEGCQIDGGYTEWSVWSTCTATCGEGTQTRTRTCTNPIPQNGGADCDGEGSQTQSCIIQGCPITSSHCDFEQEYEENCFLKEGNNDDFDWTRNFGGTETQRTGPGRARSGYYYKYIESTGKQSGATAELVSNGVFANATYCFSFYNHMKGKHIGSLEVLIVEDGIEHTVTLLDTNRKGWYMNSSNLQLHNRTKLIIRATVGSGDKGDIAVDDISLSLGAC